MPEYRKGIEQLPVYDVIERDWEIKVNANECGWNLPPLVEERVINNIARVAFNRYPNAEPDDLRELLAKHFGLRKENIWLGNGSSEIIDKLFYAFGGPGHTIVYTEPSFSMYAICAQSAEVESVVVPAENDFSLDVERFIKTVQQTHASLAVICNPNNPTGTLLTIDAIEKIAQTIGCAFLVDEAYIDFAGKKASAVPLLSKYPHLMIARTFSKAFGLAAARVGYLLASEPVISTIGKTFKPYYLNVLSTMAASIVIQMRDEFEPRIEIIMNERDRMFRELVKNSNFDVYPSHTNFILFRYDKAAQLNEHLTGANIGIRSFQNAPRLENCLRVSIGTPEENAVVLKAISDFTGGRQ